MTYSNYVKCPAKHDCFYFLFLVVFSCLDCASRAEKVELVRFLGSYLSVQL